MSTKQLSFKLLPSYPLAEGATSPDPGGVAAHGVRLYSTSTTPNRLMEWDGARWNYVPKVSSGATAPTSPKLGDIWIDPT